jgi:hypothetical protein
VETALGERCDTNGRSDALVSMVRTALGDGTKRQKFHMNPYKNNHLNEALYQGIEAQVKQ